MLLSSFLAEVHHFHVCLRARCGHEVKTDHWVDHLGASPRSVWRQRTISRRPDDKADAAPAHDNNADFCKHDNSADEPHHGANDDAGRRSQRHYDDQACSNNDDGTLRSGS